MISFPNPEWIDELKARYESLADMKEMISRLSQNLNPPKGYKLH